MKNFSILPVALAVFTSLAIAGGAIAKDATVSAGGEQLRGTRLESGVSAYLGVPYAAAPTGDLRWRAPQPHTPRHGVQNATKFGPACVQAQGNPEWYRQVAVAMGAKPDVIPTLTDISEDCLFLNVWVPPDAKRPASGWPVMVWIHGGSNSNGFAHEPNYQGQTIASHGVILVSLTYRVGLLGFFAHPALGEDATGNQGLLDQIAALQWVNKNIKAFGGDASRVTIFGESAGGTDIFALMHFPATKGLFQQAIIESGYIAPDAFTTLADAKTAALDIFGADESLKSMRALTWEQLLEKQQAKLPGHFFTPVLEGKPRLDAPLLIGSNRDEWRMYLSEDPNADYKKSLADLPEAARDDVDAYLTKLSDDIKTRADYIASAPGFLCPTKDLADGTSAAGHPAFVYLFTSVRPGNHDLGAYHGAEIPYVFDTADAWLPATDATRALTGQMTRYWVNFATHGNPNGEGLPTWPVWNAGQQPMELGDVTRPLPANVFELCTLMQRSN